jgi:hypothetical protein
MPIYEYEGLQYDIDTDDQAAAKNKILTHLGRSAAPTAPAEFSAKETALAFGQGIVGAGKSLTDVFGANNIASQGLGKVQNILGEQYSPERKAEMARREEIQKKAVQSGSLTEEISAYLGSVADAPVQSLAQGLGSIVPYVGTSVIGGIAKLGGATVKAINTVIGGMQGAGAVKGSIYDGVRNELVNSGMKLEEAEAKAAKAQEYLGGNLLDIAGGALLGGVGARVGVENMLTPGAAAKLDARLFSRMGKAALAEAPLEGAQAGQEQVAVNRALQQAGFDVDTFKGAAGAAARDAAIGALTGSAVGIRGPGAVPTTPSAVEDQKQIEEKREFLNVEKATEELQQSDPALAAKLEPKFDKKGNPIATKGEPDVIQPTNAPPSGDGTEVLGGPDTTGAAAGVAKTRPGRTGVVSDQGIEPTPQDGEGREQPTLSFKDWLMGKGNIYNSREEYEAALPELQAQYQQEMSTPTAATPTARAKTTSTPPATPVAQSYLEKPSFYGAKAPTELAIQNKTEPVEVGISHAGHEEAFDAFDTVDIRDGVMPELKALAEERNVEQEAKRKQMRQELSGKVDPETGKKYTPKRVTSLVSNVPLYQAGAPLDFLSEDQLVDLYNKHADKREFVKEERTTRSNEQQTRQQFLEGLDPLQQAKVQAIAQRSFADEVVANARRKALTTEADKRKNREKKQSDQLFFDSEQLAKDIKEDVSRREAAAQQVVEKETAEEKQLTQELKEFNKAAEKVLPKKQPSKQKPVPAKSKLITKIENAIEDNDTDAVLDAIGTDRINESGTRTIAQSFLKLVKDFGGVTIQFGELPAGEDGMFDPATNTIALNGKDGVYTGERSLDEVVMHEVGHYLTDHVVDNREAYLKSIKDVEKRKEVASALNRLDNNFRFVKDKLGDKFNIPTMKEFVAEIFGNPQFQVAIANLDQYKTSERIEGFTGPRKQFRKFEGGMLQTIVRNIANALGFSNNLEGVTLKEILDDVFKIVSLPTAELRGAEVSYAAKKPTKVPKKAPKKEAREATFDEPSKEYYPSEALAPKNLRWFKERFGTKAGWKKTATQFQNDRYPIKNWEDVLELAGKISHGVNEKFNNIYTQLTLATSDGSNFYKAYVAAPVDQLDTAIMEYAKAASISTDKVMAKLHVLFEVLHEPERRMVKYLMNVPLKDAAADRRKEILDTVRSNGKLSLSESQALRKELEAIVRNKKNIDTASKKAKDVANDEYNVLGIDQKSAEESRKQYEADPNKALLDNILDQVKVLNDATADLNKIANYWSQPVTNIVNFYGWQYYTPFKGKKYSRHGDADELLDFDSKRNGKELQELAYTFEGRESVAENPMLQVLADASRAAARAGRRNLTKSILNAVTPDADGKKLLDGSVVETIKFEDRYNIDKIFQKDKLRKIPRENTVFHYNPDGSIDIIEINSKPLREAIRRTYKDSNTMVDVANTITSRLGQLHTRYNYNFAPMNFVRDALTNAWTIGADMGPAASARFIKEITGSVAKGGLAKAMKVAHLLQKNDMAELNRLKDEAGYKDMIDYIRHGGMVSYLQSLTTKSNFDEIQKRLGKNKISKTKDQLDVIVDTWTDMFEITSRSAAFAIAKKAAMDSNLAKGMSPKEAEDAANIKAAGYAKNLANFEQVGEYGKAMGAFYMFFRPSATGAVRAIEAVAPAFTSVANAVKSLPPHIQAPKTESDARALQTFKDTYAQKQQNASIMVFALLGLGALAYTMSAMMAPDDDLGRNKLMTDNMDQWTRFWRLHVPGYETPIQVPWGFGLGSFAAAGAQLASVATGHQKPTDALANVFLQVSLDSFVPIPVSRMKPADDPLAFAIDSIAPSTVRPFIEFLINKNGLGQDIYNSASGRRMGDAFLGGDRIPEMYKNAAAAMWDATDGAIDISPNTMYFLSNSFADGPARVFEGVFGITDAATSRKEFSPKTDVPLFGSFFGAEANVDSREFSSVEKQILEKANRLKSAELKPERYAKYMEANPFDELLVESYNKDIADLNNLRKETKEIRLNNSLTPKEKQEIIKLYNFQQNIIKRNLIEQYKAYGIEP